MSRLDLTPAALELAYHSWLQVHGEGRDQNDLRFGQWLWNQYGKLGTSFPRLFYKELATDAYAIAKAEIEAD